jgi:hypothetical protein
MYYIHRTVKTEIIIQKMWTEVTACDWTVVSPRSTYHTRAVVLSSEMSTTVISNISYLPSMVRMIHVHRLLHVSRHSTYLIPTQNQFTWQCTIRTHMCKAGFVVVLSSRRDNICCGSPVYTKLVSVCEGYATHGGDKIQNAIYVTSIEHVASYKRVAKTIRVCPSNYTRVAHAYKPRNKHSPDVTDVLYRLFPTPRVLERQ